MSGPEQTIVVLSFILMLPMLLIVMPFVVGAGLLWIAERIESCRGLKR